MHPRAAVVWGDDWAAAVGRRRAAVVGEYGGAYVGPRGGAVWGDNGYGAAWTRGYAAGRPVYTGAYSKYRSYPGNVAQVNRNQAFSNNRQYNYNQNNINIDRGDRATVARGNQAIVNQGNRANVRQGDSTFTGRNEQTAVGRGDVRRTPTPGTMDQRPSGSAGAFSPWNRGSVVRASSERGQHMMSTTGKHDGLFWETKADEPPSPLGPLVAQARAEGYGRRDGENPEKKQRHPYHGYFFKILTKQGSKAPGEQYDYVINGHMVGGFAMVAWPAGYGSSGIMTFIVNQRGKVYQKDLGQATAKLASEMTEYNPDETWELVKD